MATANKGLEAFDSFTAGILARITDPAQREIAAGAIQSLRSVQPAAQAFGDGVAGQSEIDRKLQALRAQEEALATQQAQLEDRDAELQGWHSNLSTWYADQQELIQAGKKARAEGRPQGQPLPTPPATPPGGLTEEQLNERFNAERAMFLGYDRDRNAILRNHFEKFNEVVDLEPLLQHPKIREVGLTGVYELVHKDRLAQHAAAAEQKREETIRADERRKVLEGQAAMPYPVPTGAGSGSPLDALAVGKPDSLTDAASAHYARLQAERAGAAAR